MPVLDLLTAALQNAFSLEDLILLMPEYTDESHGQGSEHHFPYIRAYVLPSAWIWRAPRLRHLTLGGLTCSNSDLVGLLFLSAPNLRLLNLAGINLTDGYWADVI